MADHLSAVQRQANKGAILLIPHADVVAVFLITLVVLVITTKFAIADLRILQGFK